MNETNDDCRGAVAGPVDQPVRPSLAEALESYWDAAHAEGAEGRTHDTEDRRADSALRDVMMAVAGLINAERAAERERWRTAAEYAAHQLEKARIWGGMEWHYNPLHPMHYRSALERLRDVLRA
jgi:hypothetical protein